MVAETRWTVLLVDDTVDLRTLLRMALERSGRFHVVGEAGDGRKAIELTESLQPDLVLLDLNMPVMSGLEALPHIRAVAPRSQVVVFSGISVPEVDGAADYIIKGTPASEIVSRLTQLLERACA